VLQALNSGPLAWIPLLLIGGGTGMALALTGGGGTLIAIPLLIAVAGLATTDAMNTALVAVGVMAATGAARHWRRGEAHLGLGLFFALGGIVAAPAGALLQPLVPPPLLAALLAAVMLAVAVRTWRGGARPLPATSTYLPPELRRGRCALSSDGRLHPTSRCIPVLALAGIGTGLLSGLIGVGGGFLIVPTLMWLSRLDLRHAVATSLIAVALIALAGSAGALLHHRGAFPFMPAALTTLGGIIGMQAGGACAASLPATVLARGFALLLVGLAILVAVHG
jgi:uncharacterized membrane protein YfcA